MRIAVKHAYSHLKVWNIHCLIPTVPQKYSELTKSLRYQGALDRDERTQMIQGYLNEPINSPI